MNRPYGFTYTRAANNPWNIAATPDVTYNYDTDFHGALMAVNSSASSTSYTHDGFGRILTRIGGDDWWGLVDWWGQEAVN